MKPLTRIFYGMLLLGLVTVFSLVWLTIVLKENGQLRKLSTEQHDKLEYKDKLITKLLGDMADFEKKIAQKDLAIAHTDSLYSIEQQRARKFAKQRDEAIQAAADKAETYKTKLQEYDDRLCKTEERGDSLLSNLFLTTRRCDFFEGQYRLFVNYADSLDPWLTWLQNEANRNWWEKFWDRDKLPKPKTSMPVKPTFKAEPAGI